MDKIDFLQSNACGGAAVYRVFISFHLGPVCSLLMYQLYATISSENKGNLAEFSSHAISLENNFLKMTGVHLTPADNRLLEVYIRFGMNHYLYSSFLPSSAPHYS